MKTFENRSSFSLLVTIVIMTVSLMNCATAGKDFSEYDRDESLFKKSSTDIFNEQAAHSPDRTATLRELPEMTSDEYERLGDLYFSRGNLIMAFVQYEKSLIINPDNTRICYKKGLLSIMGEKYEAAVKDFQETLKKDPEHAMAQHGLGQAFFQMKKYDEAKKHVQKAIKLDRSLWESHNLLGIIYNHKNQHEKAIPAYKAAIALNPDDGLLYNNLGISYAASGKYEKAINTFNKALKTESSYSKIYNNLGLALSKLGRYQEAFEAFVKGGDEAQAYNNIGCIYLWQGDYVKATQSLKKAIELKTAFYEKASENLKKCRTAQLYEPNLTEYVVKNGDSLFSLAKRSGTTIKAIRDYNQLLTTKLLVGQLLLIPKR
jgi:Flp pilus assembly protein TadD